jgi:acyl-coenzyme A thioesterase PaaI-like protein
MQTELKVTLDELKQVLAQSAFVRVYDFKLEALAPGACTVRVPFRGELELPGGFVAGSVFMVAADVTMWLAIMTLLGSEPLTLTYELTSVFLKPAKQEDLYCTACILKCGKTLIYGVAECRNRHEQLLTHHIITYVRK